ncbi:MAG: hypothetical protein N2446_01515, partial [Elusimicrobiales bacterium]|nr:hypothetical protein [Elusimicrobiales bacterium]
KNFKLEQRNKIDIIYNFEPNKIFINEIKDSKLTQQEKEDLIFDFYNKFNMIENIKNEISSNSVYQIYLNNIENRPYELNENLNLTPYLYINYYSKINDTPNTFKWLYKNLEQIPDNQYSYTDLKLNLEKFYKYKEIKNIYSSNNLIEKYTTNLNYPINKHIILAAEYSKTNFINKDIFKIKNKEKKSINIEIKNKNNIELSYNLWLKDFLAIRLYKNTIFPRKEIQIGAGLNQKVNITTLSNILFLNDYISLQLTQKHKQTSKTTILTLFSNYKDLNKKFFGSSKSLEIHHQLKYKHLFITPYLKYSSFNSKNIYINNNIIKGSQQILPQNFAEIGTNLYLNYNKSFVITFIPAYNNKSNINYTLAVKIHKILKENSQIEINLTHSKNYEIKNSINTNIELSYKF